MGSEQEAQLPRLKRHGIRLQKEDPKKRKAEEASKAATSEKVVDVERIV